MQSQAPYFLRALDLVSFALLAVLTLIVYFSAERKECIRFESGRIAFTFLRSADRTIASKNGSNKTLARSAGFRFLHFKAYSLSG